MPVSTVLQPVPTARDERRQRRLPARPAFEDEAVKADGGPGAQPPGTRATTHPHPTTPRPTQECPSSADASSSVTGTDPESGAGRSGNGSIRVSSITGGAGCGVFGITAASE